MKRILWSTLTRQSLFFSDMLLHMPAPDGSHVLSVPRSKPRQLRNLQHQHLRLRLPGFQALPQLMQLPHQARLAGRRPRLHLVHLISGRLQLRHHQLELRPRLRYSTRNASLVRRSQHRELSGSIGADGALCICGSRLVLCQLPMQQPDLHCRVLQGGHQAQVEGLKVTVR